MLGQTLGLVSGDSAFLRGLRRFRVVGTAFDMFHRIMGAAGVPHAGTSCSGIVPALLTLNVLFPEWPCAALCGANGIYTAFGFAVGSFQEDAIEILILGQADATGQLPQIFSAKSLDIHPQKLADLQNVIIRHPNIPRPSGAAIAALSAVEMQALFVPR